MHKGIIALVSASLGGVIGYLLKEPDIVEKVHLIERPVVRPVVISPRLRVDVEKEALRQRVLDLEQKLSVKRVVNVSISSVMNTDEDNYAQIMQYLRTHDSEGWGEVKTAMRKTYWWGAKRKELVDNWSSIFSGLPMPEDFQEFENDFSNIYVELNPNSTNERLRKVYETIYPKYLILREKRLAAASFQRSYKDSDLLHKEVVETRRAYHDLLESVLHLVDEEEKARLVAELSFSVEDK